MKPTSTVTISREVYEILQEKSRRLDRFYELTSQRAKDELKSGNLHAANSVAADAKFNEIKRQVQIMKRMTAIVSEFLFKVANKTKDDQLSESFRAIAYIVAPDNFEQFADMDPGDLMGIYSPKKQKLNMENVISIGHQE